MIVSSLVCPLSCSWNRAVVCDLLEPRSTSAIFSISLPHLALPDKWIWSLESSSSFSVKSLFWALTPRFDLVVLGLDESDWKRLWSLKLHARLKLLLWKVSWNILPTRARLASALHFSVEDDLLCPLCGYFEESLHHLFLVCSFSRIAWMESRWRSNLLPFADISLSSWILMILQPALLLDILVADVHDFQLFVVISMDLVWANHNKIVHGSRSLDPVQLALQISASSRKHWVACLTRSQSSLNAIWSPPPLG